MLVIEAERKANDEINDEIPGELEHLPMQMIWGIVEKGVILANEFASNNKRRWFGLHYHGTSYDTL